MTREEAKGNLKHAIRWNDMPKKEALEMAIKALEQESKIVNLGDNVVYGTDGNLYKITVSSGKEYEQEPKTGHWIRVDKDKCKCDQCEVISFIAMYPNGDINYCPECGRKMVKPQESEEV